MCSINYEFYKNHNICVRCGHEDAEKGHTLCLECMMNDRERGKLYYQKHKEEKKEKSRINSKARYYKLKENGLCTSCGKRKAKENKVFCEFCSSWKNAIKREKYLLNAYATRNMAEIRI